MYLIQLIIISKLFFIYLRAQNIVPCGNNCLIICNYWQSDNKGQTCALFKYFLGLDYSVFICCLL